jgi:pyochelin biosynthetic protein PchC
MTKASDEGSWTRRFHPAPDSAVRLVCLPHAGGSASFYFPVSRALSPAVDVLAVQYPGRQDRRHEPLVPDVPTLARLVAGELAGWLDRPLALFGHSLGASLAFEVARILRREHDLVRLFASGRRAPSRFRDERVHQGSDADLIAEMRGLEGTAGSILGDEELLHMIMPAIRNDYRAAETYRYEPGPPLRCPVTALVGAADPKVTVDEARAWSQHTTGDFELEVFPGGHFYLAAHQAAVIERIRGGIGVAVGVA